MREPSDAEIQPLPNRRRHATHEPLTDAAELRQLSLEGMALNRPPYVPERLRGQREPLGYSLFFAGFPEPADAARLCDQGAQLAREHGLSKAVQAPERAHVTLCSLTGADPLDQARHDAAKAAAGRLACLALPIRFNRARSFTQTGAFMLLGDPATNAAVTSLQRQLVAALRRFGLKPEKVAAPHMTAVYNCGKVVPEQSIAPLAWTMRRLALVLSHIGNAHHEYLGEWTLS